jgi:hypothetical protein
VSRKAVSKLVPPAIPLGAVLAVAFLVCGAMLHRFYVRGAYVLDTALFSGILYRSESLALPHPAILGGTSFYGTHISPIFSLLSVPSYILPLGAAPFFSVIMTLAVVGTPILSWRLLADLDRRGLPTGPVVKGLAVLATGLNAIALNTLSYPHPELLWVPLAFGFFWALLTSRRGAALAFFVLCLALREDAGLHLFGFLALYIVGTVLRREPLARAWTPGLYALAAVLAAAVGFALVSHLRAGPSLASSLYFGEPAYAHLTVEHLAGRLVRHVETQLYVFVPYALLVLISLGRAPWRYLPVLAPLPWLGLHVAAPDTGVSMMSSYRVFPFLLAFLWPLLVAAESRTAPVARPRREVAAALAPLLASALLFLPTGAGRATYGTVGTEAWRAAFRGEAAIASAVRHLDDLGHVHADHPTMALAPDGFSVDHQRIPADPRSLDTILYWHEAPYGPRVAPLMVLLSPDMRTYAVPGTPLRLALNRDRPLPDAMASHFQPVTRPVAAGFKLRGAAPERPSSTLRLPPDSAARPALDGPYLDLPQGRYTVRLGIETPGVPNTQTQARTTGDVVSDYGRRTLRRFERRLPAGPDRAVTIPFEIPDAPARAVQLRLYNPGPHALQLLDVALQPHRPDVVWSRLRERAPVWVKQ